MGKCQPIHHSNNLPVPTEDTLLFSFLKHFDLFKFLILQKKDIPK